MVYKIFYKSSVEKDLKKIPGKEHFEILDRLENDLAKHPGKDKQLSGNFKGLYSYRIGNYRVIYSIFNKSVLILRIAHRQEAYE